MTKDKVQCQICKRWFKQLTGTHLKNKHNITFEKYKEMFPDAETHPQWLRNQLIDANVEKWSDQDYKDNIADKNSKIIKEMWDDGKFSRTQSEDHKNKRRDSTLETKRENPEFKETVSTICPVCGNEFKISQSRIGLVNHCSIECYMESIELNKITIICKYCGDEFKVNPGDKYKQYCSKECYDNNKSGENNPMFGRKQPDSAKQIISEKADKRWDDMEERILQSCRMLGISREEWNGFTNKSDDLYYSQKYKQWRTSVYQRDDYTCQMCGERGGKLNGHHIYKVSDYPELIFEINNGITLCYDCHFHKVNGHEKEYEIELLSKIFDNKGIEIFGGEC